MIARGGSRFLLVNSRQIRG